MADVREPSSLTRNERPRASDAVHARSAAGEGQWQGAKEAETAVGQYVYCIIRCPNSCKFTTRGIGERGDLVHTVNVKGLAAVVSDSPVAEYESSRRNMLAHTRVLEEVMQSFTILPVRFGTIAPSTETLTSTQAIREKLLDRRHDEFSGLIEEMRGRVELGLKAFWYEDTIFREVVEENPAIRRLRDGLMDRSPEETYYDRIRLGEMVGAAVGKKRIVEAETILNRLRSLVYKTRDNKVISDRMVLNGAFLVNEDREAAFDATVKELEAEMGKRLLFKYVGLVPPYNFVNIVVRWED